MTKTPTSPTGKRRDKKWQAGFTLMELLVVMTIIAFAAGSVAYWTGAGGGRSGLKATAAQVASHLRNVRTDAIRRHGDAVVLIDVADRSLDASGTRQTLTLAGDLELSLEVAEAERLSKTRAGIRFFADGSSTGGSLRLARNREAYEIRVNWFTGRVTIVASP